MSAFAIASGAGRSTMRTVPRDCATQPSTRHSARIFATPSHVAPTKSGRSACEMGTRRRAVPDVAAGKTDFDPHTVELRKKVDAVWIDTQRPRWSERQIAAFRSFSPMSRRKRRLGGSHSRRPSSARRAIEAQIPPSAYRRGFTKSGAPMSSGD